MEMIKHLLKRISKRFFRSPTATRPCGVTVGENSDCLGSFTVRQLGGEIIIGKDCMIEAALGTETPYSRLRIGDNVYIGRSTVWCIQEVVIEDDVLISSECLIQDSDNHNLKYSVRKRDCQDWKRSRSHDWSVTPTAPIYVRKGAWVGAKAIILKGVTIGEGAVVGAGSVVTRDVQPFTVVAGNPARFIKAIEDDEAN